MYPRRTLQKENPSIIERGQKSAEETELLSSRVPPPWASTESACSLPTTTAISSPLRKSRDIATSGSRRYLSEKCPPS
jgi:hypothetical protein